MKHNSGKIKREHGIMQDFLPLLRKIEKIDAVQRIIPGRVARSQGGSGQLHFTLSYATDSGLKYMMKKGGTAQELFILVSEEKKDTLTKMIQDIIKQHKHISG